MRKLLLPVLLVLGAMPASAQTQATAPLSAGFARALSAAGEGRAAEAMARRRAGWDGKLEAWLGPLDALLRQQGEDADAAAARAAEGLRAGRFDALILGESHGDALEQRAAGRILRGVQGARPIGAAIFEETQTDDGSTQYIYPDTAWMAGAGIKVLGYRDHFHPDKEYGQALAAAGRGVLVSYTGSAHTARKIRDYVIDTLDDGLGPYHRGGLTLTTIEDAALRRRKKPLIAAMLEEAFVFGRVQDLIVAQIAARRPTLADARADLAAASAAWRARVAQYPAAPSATRFFPFPGQDNLLLGLTAGDRSPKGLDALAAVAGSPDCASWLGGRRLKSLFAGREESRDASGRVIQADWHVQLTDEKGAVFDRSLPIAAP